MLVSTQCLCCSKHIRPNCTRWNRIRIAKTYILKPGTFRFTTTTVFSFLCCFSFHFSRDLTSVNERNRQTFDRLVCVKCFKLGKLSTNITKNRMRNGINTAWMQFNIVHRSRKIYQVFFWCVSEARTLELPSFYCNKYTPCKHPSHFPPLSLSLTVF